MSKPAFCICENKAADQLCGNHTADQRLCFRHTDSTIPLLPKYQISRLWPSCVVAQPVLCGPGRKPRRPVFSQRGSFTSHKISRTRNFCEFPPIIQSLLCFWNSDISSEYDGNDIFVTSLGLVRYTLIFLFFFFFFFVMPQYNFPCEVFLDGHAHCDFYDCKIDNFQLKSYMLFHNIDCVLSTH